MSLHCMVLHGIVLLASARGLYLARHLPTLLVLKAIKEFAIKLHCIQPGHVVHFEPLECGGHHLDNGILCHPCHLDPWQYAGALDGPRPPSNVESHQLLPRQPGCGRPWHGRVQLHTWVS